MPQAPDVETPDEPFVSHANPVTQAGYSPVPNVVVLRHDLSLGAKLLYGYLKHLAWRNSTSTVDPPREILARDLGISVPTVTALLRELQRAPVSEGDDSKDAERLVVARRRGQGKTNVYVVNDPEMPTSRKQDPFFLDGNAVSVPARAPVTRTPKKTAKEVGTAIAVPERRRNIVYDALAEACDIRPALLDPASPIHDKDLRKELGVAQAAIRAKAQGLSDEDLAEEVALRCRAYRERWPDIDITPSAVAKHWNRVVSEAPSRGVTASRAHAIATAAEQHYRKGQQ